MRFTDFGAYSKESTDYPEFAQAVARAVASKSHDLGVLVCTSGVGMSIAANKVPGARAALVWDEEMAALSRQHNDANIVCIGSKQCSPEKAAHKIGRAHV